MGVLIDLFVAGMETTTTTIQWLLAYIVNYPQFQERIQRELDANVGKSRLPVLQDKQNLPFTEAFILEVMRLSSIVPISLPHAPNRDAEFRGHRIPKGVILLPVFDSVFRDPKLWDDPNTFHPDRFLDKEGKVQKPEYHIAFSLGELFSRYSLSRYEPLTYRVHKRWAPSHVEKPDIFLRQDMIKGNLSDLI